MKRTTTLLVLGATSYIVVAWQVSPGFYDGVPTAPQYNWVSPPPFVTSNNPPELGHDDIAVVDGVNGPSAAATLDGQLVIGFLPGVFDAAGKTNITVDIKPIANFPDPGGLRFVTNVYLVTSSASLVKDASIVMLFSGVLPAPSDVYLSTGDSGPWASIGSSSQAQPWTINTRTRQFGYFAAGYRAGRVGSSSQILPIAIAILIAGVLLAGIPLAIVRRRKGTEADEAEVDGS